MLDSLFYPRSIAIVGAARDEGKIGYTVLAKTLNYNPKCPVYPINPKGGVILGLKAYPSVLDVPDAVDLGIIVVPTKVVPQAVKECIEKGTRAVAIITAGFREVDKEGARVEQEIVKMASEAGMRVLGPNCLGLINTDYRLDTTFAPNHALSGDVSCMTQSGALGCAILDWAEKELLGFNKFVSLGNKSDIDESDLIDAWRDDPATRVIVGYLEGVANGPRFMRAAKALTKKKPMIVVKAGRSAAGSRAAASHTGTLTGSDGAYDAACRQTGIMRVTSFEQVFDLAAAFSYQPLPKGNRVAILTNAGGPGVMATDAIEKEGLQLATFTPETIAALRERLPAMAALHNPVDVIGDAGAERYEAALDVIVHDPNVDSVVALLVPTTVVDMAAVARVVAKYAARGEKTIVTSFTGGVRASEGTRIFAENRVPNYPFPERAVAALAAMCRYRDWQVKPEDEPRKFEVNKAAAAEIINQVKQSGRDSLGDIETLQVLDAYGIKTPGAKLSRSPEESVRLAEEVGYPVVMKIVSPDILHKSDVGGVRVGLTTAEEVKNAHITIINNAQRAVPDANIRGISVQRMVPRGRETILGVTRDATFGHMIAFGLGGIYVEVMKDVTFRLAPLTPNDAREMISEIRSYPLLKGVRGEEPADMEAIVDALLRLSQLVTDFPEIAEMDINPLMVATQGQGATAIDGRMILVKPTGVEDMPKASTISSPSLS